MIQETVWKKIKIRGLERYEISETKYVRIASTKKMLAHATIEDELVVSLINNRGVKKAYAINSLFYLTFRHSNMDDDDEIPVITIFNMKDDPFSEDEDQYGKGVNKKHWEDLKAEIAERKRIVGGDSTI